MKMLKGSEPMVEQSKKAPEGVSTLPLLMSSRARRNAVLNEFHVLNNNKPTRIGAHCGASIGDQYYNFY